MKPLTISLSFFIVILMVVTSTADALVQSIDYCPATATTCNTPVKLGLGNNGSSSVSTTGDYGTANITAGMRFNENTTATVSTSTPMLDSHVSNAFPFDSFDQSGTTSKISTTAANELIYVIVSIEGSSSVDSVTGGSLTWYQRGWATDHKGERVETWYAISPTLLNNQSLTINLDHPATFITIVSCIKGVNTAQPFDPNVQSPVSSHGKGTSTQSVTMSTTNSNDFIIGALAASCSDWSLPYPDPMAGQGFTTIDSITNSWYFAGAGEYRTTSSAQSSASISFSTITSYYYPFYYYCPCNWAMIGDAIQGGAQSASYSTSVSSPINDTSLSTPSSSDSYDIPAGSSAYLWSPTFTNTTTIYSGSWVLDLWAKASSGTMNVMFAAVNSSGAITSIAASGKTGTILTSESEIKTTFSGSNITVPSGGRLVAILNNPAGSGTCTVYWGPSSMTNFQTPKDFSHIIAIKNTVSSSYSVSITAYSTSSISRLTNLTVSLCSPETTEVKITNGVLTQSSGTGVKLNGGSTLYVHAVATANAFGCSNITLLIKISTGGGPYFYQVLNLTVN